MKRFINTAMAFAILAMIISPGQAAAETNPRGGCEVRNEGSAENNFQKHYNCKRPNGTFLGFRRVEKCVAHCGDLIGNQNTLVPNPVDNNEWKQAFVDGAYRKDDVYTDFTLEIEYETLNTGGMKTCEFFGLAGATARNLVGTENEQTVTLSVAISDTQINLSDLSDAKALVFPILQAKRTVNGGKCISGAVTGAGGLIARVLASPKRNLYAQVLLVRGSIKNPIGGLVSTDGGSGAAKLLENILNGDLLDYAPDIALVADNLNSDTTTALASNQLIRSYPLKTSGPDPHRFEKLEYDVKIGGQSLAKFTIFQDPDIDESGPLNRAESFKAVSTEDFLADLDRNTRKPELASISDVLTASDSNFDYITQPMTYTDADLLSSACGDIKVALTNFDVSNRAIDSLRASMINDFKSPNILTQAKYQDICLSQEQRADSERYPGIQDTLRGAGEARQLVRNDPTCIEMSGEYGETVISRVTGNAVDDILGFRTQASSSKTLTKGDWYETIAENGEEPFELLEKFGGYSRCHVGIMDVPGATGRNRQCQFAFWAKTEPPNAKEVWVLVEAEGRQSQLPEITRYRVGINPKNHILKSTLEAHYRQQCKNYATTLYQ